MQTNKQKVTVDRGLRKRTTIVLDNRCAAQSVHAHISAKNSDLRNKCAHATSETVPIDTAWNWAKPTRKQSYSSIYCPTCTFSDAPPIIRGSSPSHRHRASELPDRLDLPRRGIPADPEMPVIVRIPLQPVLPHNLVPLDFVERFGVLGHVERGKFRVTSR